MNPKKVSGKDGSKKKKKKRMMTMELKHEIVDNYERGARVTDLARMYDRSTSTICTILKQKDAIKNANPSKGVMVISKLRSTINEVEKLLLLWMNEKQMSQDAITYSIICEKASLIYDDLKQKDAAEEGETSALGESFKASRGWFHNFKKRTGIHSVRHGKAAEKYIERFATLVASEENAPNKSSIATRWDVFGKKRTFITAEENKCQCKQQGHKPMKDRLTLDSCANASGDQSSVLERTMLVSQGAKSGPSQSTETVSQLDFTSAAGVFMASEEFTGHLTGDATDSKEKSDAVEEYTLEATEASVNETNPPNNQTEQEEVETLQEAIEKDLDFHQLDQGKSSTTDQEEEENFAQGHCEQKDNRERAKNEDKNNTDNMAQSSEELVIAKVEDFTNEMAIDVDQTEDRDGKMEVDGPEDAGKLLANPIKSEKTEPSAMQTHSVLKTELKAHPSIVIPVKVKDEPMDEEYENASAPVRPVGNIKDEPDTAADFNQTPDAIKISAVFSVGGNATPIAPAVVPAKGAPIPTVSLRPLAPANPIGVVCTGCSKVLLKGQTAFQRKGCPKLYCSPQCLCSTSAMVVKIPQKRQCYHCLKEILDPKDVVNASVDMSGTLKEFCSQTCVSSLSFKCSVCQKSGMMYTHEVNFMDSIHKLCSDGCFNQFRSSNKLNMNSCVNCGGYCYGTDSQCPSLRIEGSVMKFCKQNCLVAFKQKSLKPVSCKICRAIRPVAEMVDGLSTDGVRELFCSASCVTANKVQTVSTSGVPVECNNCKLKLSPQYHLAMSDGTIQNFCSFPCVVSYQESFSKIKPNNQVNMVTSTTNATSSQKPAALKAASLDSSSSTKTSAPSGPVQTVTKIPCSQCLNSFFHRPELLDFKRKMYAFCSNTCVEEFKQINNVMARCEYCKIDKVVKEVKRINKIDRSFCSEGCKLLYKHDLVKRWGKKHCRNCFYCSGSSQTVVTEVFDHTEEEFCGTVCLQQHTLLMRKEIKCSMCRQAKMMAETVKWLGEIKHFCSLQCLMFFCSLQGITGPVRPASKPLSTQGTSPAPSPAPQSAVNRTMLITKEATPVIANVISLSSASNGQPCILGNSVLQGSIPAATVKSSGNTTSTQTDGVKASTPAPRILKNKALLCKPFCQNKGTSCKPNVCDVNTQTDGPSVIVLPVPVPVYVPVPMNLYTQYTPKSVGLPLPIPVPLFFPTTLDSAERIVKTIQEIKEKIPDDPLEADLIMMAEMVAEDTEREKNIASSGQAGNIMDDLDLEALSSNLSWEEDSVSSAQIWDQPPEPERPPPSRSATLSHASTVTEEPQMDLEADFPVEGIELFREQTQKETTDSGKRKSRKRGRDGTQKKRGRKSAATVPAKPALDNFSNLSKLQNEYAVNAWKDWVRWRNAQPNIETPKFGSRSMTIKEDLLKCCTAELSYGLCKFISEVRRPNGENYSPDSIFYLCLGIQQYLFENNRMENIFSDVFYTKFCNEMTGILKEWKPTILPSGYVHSRVEEEYLWDCKQLGAFSPGVLLNTLLYFFTKFFNYKTVEQHRRLSFGHIVRCSRSKGSTKMACLRFYPPKEDVSSDGVPAKKRKEEEEENETIYEIKENSDNPLRCPVRLYEFYISKCSPSVRQCTTQFYLSPERSCVPCSPMWFSTSSLSDEVLDSMLTRILTVRELHLETDKTPTETDSDNDSDF